MSPVRTQKQMDIWYVKRKISHGRFFFTEAVLYNGKSTDFVTLTV